MIYELRIYHIHPGRMDAIHERFREHTLDLFAKHGMGVIDFWEDLETNTIYYTMEHPDKETRDRNFASFVADPEWIAVRDKSEESGPIVKQVDSYLMKRVPYSPKS